MGAQINVGIPQWLFTQEATPTATFQGQLWVKLSTNVLYQANALLNWVAVATTSALTLISSNTLTNSAGWTSAALSGYTKIVVCYNLIGSSGTSSVVYLTFNGSSAANYSYASVAAWATWSRVTADTKIQLSNSVKSSDAAAGQFTFEVAAKGSSNSHGIYGTLGTNTNSGVSMWGGSADWTNASDITTFTLTPTGGQTLSGRVDIYGLN